MILLPPESIKVAVPSFTSSTHIFLPVSSTSIFLPISDSGHVSLSESSSHWSLLLVSVTDGVAFHYDSRSPLNYEEGRQATQKISTLVSRSLKFYDLCDGPPLDSVHDCGVHVCVVMRHLLVRRLLNAKYNEKVSMSMATKMVDFEAARKTIRKAIEECKIEMEQPERNKKQTERDKERRNPSYVLRRKLF